MGTVSIGGSSFNIYGTFTDDTGPVISAVTYFKASLNISAWSAAASSDKQKALVAATRILDKQPWVGSPTDIVTPQPLAWPRTGATDADGNSFLDTETPEEVIFANYELASAILADAAVQSSSTSGSNVRRTLSRDKVGDLETERETEYFIPTIIGSAASGRFPTSVQEYLRGLLGGSLDLSTVTGSTASTFLSKTFCAVDPAS